MTQPMTKPKPKVSITEAQRLKAIALSTRAEGSEIIDALIYWAYHLPPDAGGEMPQLQWREILYSYRRARRQQP